MENRRDMPTSVIAGGRPAGWDGRFPFRTESAADQRISVQAENLVKVGRWVRGGERAVHRRQSDLASPAHDFVSLFHRVALDRSSASASLFPGMPCLRPCC
jgi:hypothetical protein